MAYEIPLFDLNYDAAEEAAVLEVLRSRWISMGERTAQLERQFADHLGVRHAIAMSSCTSALHLALVALDIHPGDEVIVPSLTFVATVNAVRYTGATPVFADIVGAEDFSIDPQSVVRAITPSTRAIIAMHYGGFACDMAALQAIADEHGLAIIEDAAHAPASQYGDRALGTLGRVGCFSFFSNKNLTCAEGGMLVTGDDVIASRVRLLRSHGMTTLSFDRAQGHATRYDVLELGYNYRMDDIRAALVLAQMDKLRTDVERRAEVRRMYLESLADVDGIIVPYRRHPHASSHYIFPVVLAEGGATRRDAIRERIAALGVQTSVHYPAVHRFSIYAQDGSVSLPRTEAVADAEITLPMYGSLKRREVSQVVDALLDALGNKF